MINEEIVDKLIALREVANRKLKANNELGFCGGISCFECPMNLGINEIVCLEDAQVIR
jgi:hypothetical protein